MKSAVASPLPAISREEVERRIAEYRRLGFEYRSAAVIVYPPSQQLCPWPACGAAISAIDFRLDRMGNATQFEKWLAAWWREQGLVARCPGCGRYVLFGHEGKQPVENSADRPDAILPDDWVVKAQIAPRPRE
jgi:hypothetical protein